MYFFYDIIQDAVTITLCRKETLHFWFLSHGQCQLVDCGMSTTALDFFLLVLGSQFVAFCSYWLNYDLLAISKKPIK